MSIVNSCVNRKKITLEEAREMARDAIRAYLESLIKDGEPIPEEEDTMQEKIQVAVEASF